MPIHMGWHQPWWQRGDGSPGQRVGCEGCGSPGGGSRGAGAARRGSGDAGGAGGFPTASLIEIGSPRA